MTIKVEWRDAGRWPKVAPNPAYPNGVDVDLDTKGERTCKVEVPYPARRIGAYLLECDVCGLTAMVTTAGRHDDPRSVSLPCKRRDDA